MPILFRAWMTAGSTALAAGLLAAAGSVEAAGWTDAGRETGAEAEAVGAGLLHAASETPSTAILKTRYIANLTGFDAITEDNP
ncbi:exported hypothetical protein [Cupriavidus necator]|uniref:Uncharacterized protein n=1 Tax=Cupriavidus necator TaxID=106590 RepID=A0A1K0IPG0_CUPNE|nr:exported hypothetical protein [Cupriavidus necator]